jgi:imidazolonepropionase-like amidohydrolase
MTRHCIQDIRLLDGLGGDIPSADVLISNGVITDIRIPSSPAPSDYAAIQGNQRTLMPGLIDGHVHLLFDSSPEAPMAMLGKSREQLIADALERARITLKSGVTCIRELSGTPKATFSLRDALAGEKCIPRIVDCFATLTAEGGFGSAVALGITKQNAASVIGSYAEKADFLKLLGDRYDSESPDGFAPHFDDASFAEICRIARHMGKRVTAHAKCSASIRQCLKNGVHSIEHAVRAEDADLKEMAAQGIFLDATFLGLKCRAENQPDFDEFDRVKAYYPRACRFGVRLTTGSDAGAFFTPHGGLVKELEFMVQAGMSPLDAIKAATSVSALRLGDKSIGAVEVGRKADLLLIGNDPLQDISAVQHSLCWVMKDGQIC